MDHIIEKNKKIRKGRVYFTKDTEAAIVRYNASIDKEERSDIYQDHIHWAFYKLTCLTLKMGQRHIHILVQL